MSNITDKQIKALTADGVIVRPILWVSKHGLDMVSHVYVDTKTGKVLAIYTKVNERAGTKAYTGKVFIDDAKDSMANYKIE